MSKQYFLRLPNNHRNDLYTKIALHATRKELAFLRLAHDPIAFGIWELVEDERDRILTKLKEENKRLREELRSIRGEMRSQAHRKQ